VSCAAPFSALLSRAAAQAKKVGGFSFGKK
jgi:hypothetical protein